MRRSPIFSHLTSSVNGIVLIRAFNAEKLLMSEFDRILNLHTSSYFTKLALLRWFASTTMWITWGNLMIMTDKSELISEVLLQCIHLIRFSDMLCLHFAVLW